MQSSDRNPVPGSPDTAPPAGAPNPTIPASPSTPSSLSAPGSPLSAPPPHPGSPREVFAAFLKLGCSAFGGPVAHLGYFHLAFVSRRQWLDDRAYADLVALCQFLPGPTSSQVGLALGWQRAGWRGALAAWFAFTAPSAVLMFVFALGVARMGGLTYAGWIQGLKIAAAVVVFQAVRLMAARLCPDIPRAVIAVAATAAILLWPQPWTQLLVLALGAILGLLFLRAGPSLPPTPAASSALSLSILGSPLSASPPPLASPIPTTHPPPSGTSPGATPSTSSPQPEISSSPPQSVNRKPKTFLFFLAFFLFLLVLPWLAQLWPVPALQVFSGFYRAGSLVFGGGHVVLPLLEQVTVAPGWLDKSTFLAGYGAAQALPGPLFAFSVYLGALILPGGLLGALLALVAIYLPSIFLLFGTLPHWNRLRASPNAQVLLAGANAAVVGLLAAAFYNPIWTSTITTPGRFAFALAAALALEILRLPPWLVVLACALLGQFTLA